MTKQGSLDIYKEPWAHSTVYMSQRFYVVHLRLSSREAEWSHLSFFPMRAFTRVTCRSGFRLAVRKFDLLNPSQCTNMCIMMAIYAVVTYVQAPNGFYRFQRADCTTGTLYYTLQYSQCSICVKCRTAGQLSVWAMTLLYKSAVYSGFLTLRPSPTLVHVYGVQLSCFTVR